MFVRVLSCALCALLVSPVSAEFLVQDGDYYANLVSSQPIRIIGGRVDYIGPNNQVPITLEGGSVGVIDTGAGVRITGGRVDKVTAGNEHFPLVIEGGSIGEFVDWGNSTYVFRTGNFQLDVEPIDLFDITFVTVEGFWPVTGSDFVGGMFADFSYREINFLADQHSYIDLTFVRVPLPPGDTQADGVVDLVDLNNVRNHFGWQTSAPDGDTNGDDVIDLEDLNAVRNNFGTVYRPSSNPVPEPSSLALMASAGVVASLRRRR